jgi:hypothetical protein
VSIVLQQLVSVVAIVLQHLQQPNNEVERVLWTFQKCLPWKKKLKKSSMKCYVPSLWANHKYVCFTTKIESCATIKPTKNQVQHSRNYEDACNCISLSFEVQGVEKKL